VIGGEPTTPDLRENNNKRKNIVGKGKKKNQIIPAGSDRKNKSKIISLVAIRME